MENETSKAVETPKETVVLFSIVDDTPLALVIKALAVKAEAHNKGSHSVQYWAEDMLTRGATAFSNYLDADKERRDLVEFNKEFNKLVSPPIIDMLKPLEAQADIIKANVAYQQQVDNLKRRFRQGSYKATL